MVASLAALAPHDEQLTELLLEGGELTWRAGPLKKGAGLCHGTAGNGYAFLKLFERTGDELWLERARAFAMHAAEQIEQSRAQHGRGRHTLWTGDLGAAVYLQGLRHRIDGLSDARLLLAFRNLIREANQIPELPVGAPNSRYSSAGSRARATARWRR